MAKRRGEATHEQDRLIHFVDGYDIQLGAGAATYLAGMGDYSDVTGVRHYLHASEPGNDGHFGVINERTHRDYETKIAPAVSFNRILSDIATTEDHNELEFIMPGGILPDPPERAQPAQAEPLPPVRGRGRPRQRRAELALLLDQQPGVDAPAQVAEPPLGPGAQDEPVEALDGVQDSDGEEEGDPVEAEPQHKPTANLLGWRTPQPLNKNQHSNLRRIITDPDDVEFTNARYRIHTRIFEFVFNKLREAKRYKLLPIPKSTTGSVVQQLAWMPEEAIIDRNSQYIAGQGRVVSRTNVPLFKSNL